MLKERKNYQSCLRVLIMLVSQSIQNSIGKKEGGFLDIGGGIEMTEGETLNININKSLSYYSRGEVQGNKTLSHFRILIDNQAEADRVIQHAARDFGKNCTSNMTQISRDSVAYFCKGGASGESGERQEGPFRHLMVFDSRRMGVTGIRVDLFEAEHSCNMTQAASSYRDGLFFGVCGDRVNRKIYVVEMMDNEMDGLSFGAYKEIDVGVKKFNFEDIRVRPAIQEDGTLTLSVFSVVVEPGRIPILEKRLTIIYSIFYTKEGLFLDQWKYGDIEELGILRLGYKHIFLFETDGSDLFFFVSKQGRPEESWGDQIDLLIGNFDSQLNFIWKSTVRNISSKFNINVKSNELFSVANLKYLYNIPSVEKSGSEETYKRDIAFVSDYSTKAKRGIRYYYIDKKQGRVIRTIEMNEQRYKSIVSLIQKFKKMDLVGETVAFHQQAIPKSEKKKGKLFIWHSQIFDEKETYPISIEFPKIAIGPGTEQWRSMVLDEYTEESSTPILDKPRYSYKKVVFIGSHGTIVVKRLSPPRIKIKFKGSGIQANPRTAVAHRFNYYNQNTTEWYSTDISVNLTRKGGSVELESLRNFRLETFKREKTIFHLPKILRGNGVKIDFEIEPKLTTIELKYINFDRITFKGIDFSRPIQEFRVTNSHYLVVKYRDEINYRFFRCQLVPFTHSYDCFEKYVTQLTKNSTVLAIEHFNEERPLFLVLKEDSNSHIFVKYLPDYKKSYSRRAGFLGSYCYIKRLEGIEVEDGLIFDGKFWFIGKNITGNTQRNSLYEWDNRNMQRWEVPEVTQQGKKLSFSKIFQVKKMNSRNNQREIEYFIVLKTPYLTIFKLSLSNADMPPSKQKRSASFIYNSPMIQFEDDPIIAIDDKNHWMTYLTKDLEKKFTFMNFDFSTGNGQECKIGRYEIKSDYNDIYFGGRFKQIKDIRIICNVGRKSLCYGFFFGVLKQEFITEQSRNHSVVALVLNHRTDASSKILGMFEIQEFDSLKQATYIKDMDSFQLKFDKEEPGQFEVHMMQRTNIPSILMNLGNIKNSTSSGKIKIRARIRDHLGSGNDKEVEGIINIHKSRNDIKLVTPVARKDRKFINKTAIELESLLKFEGWIKDIRIVKKSNIEFVKRLQEIEDEGMRSCLETQNNFENLKISEFEDIIQTEKTVFVIARNWDPIERLVVLVLSKRGKNGKCEMEKFSYKSQFIKAKLVKRKYPLEEDILILATSFQEKVGNTSKINFIQIQFKETLSSFKEVRKTVSIKGAINNQISDINFLSGREPLLVFSSLKKDNQEQRFSEQILTISYNLLTFEENFGYQILDYGNMKLDMEGEREVGAGLESKIIQLESSSYGDNLILLVRSHLSNNLKILYLRNELFEHESACKRTESGPGIPYYRLEFITFQTSSLIFKTDEDISELGLSNSTIRLEHNIEESRVGLVLANDKFYSYVFELKFNDFYWIRNHNFHILAEPIVAKKYIRNPEGYGRPLSVDFVGKSMVKIEYKDLTQENWSMIALFDVTTQEEKTKKKSRVSEIELEDRIFPLVIKKIQMKSTMVRLSYAGANYFEESKDILRMDVFELNPKVFHVNEIQVGVFQINRCYLLKITSPSSISLGGTKLVFESLSGDTKEVTFDKIFNKPMDKVIPFVMLAVLVGVLLVILAKYHNTQKGSPKPISVGDAPGVKKAGKGGRDVSLLTKISFEDTIEEHSNDLSLDQVLSNIDDQFELQSETMTNCLDRSDSLTEELSNEEERAESSLVDEGGDSKLINVVEDDYQRMESDEEYGECKDDGAEDSRSRGSSLESEEDGSGEEEYFFEDDFMVEDYFDYQNNDNSGLSYHQDSADDGSFGSGGSEEEQGRDLEEEEGSIDG